MRLVLLLLALQIAAGVSAQTADTSGLMTIDRFVPHVSTVPANAGQHVGLFLREKVSPGSDAAIRAGVAPEGRVVLFVHGVSVPSIPDFDLDLRDYSWMEFLAARGFDVFAMDHTGYGYSPRPAMDTPCNLAPAERALLDEEIAAANCAPEYQSVLTSSETDWDEIDSVVDYLREMRGVDRVSLVAWSLGGLRAGGYAARFADKIDKLVLFAPFYQPMSEDAPPTDFPAAGPPLNLQTKQALLRDRWSSNVVCDNQYEPDVPEHVWQTIMAFDSYGSGWLSSDGVMRVRSASYWGWNQASAAEVTAPTLILIGLQDGLLPGAEALYRDLGSVDNKVLVRMECATHFAVWEASQYRFMHEASLEWLTETRYRGRDSGEYHVASGGVEID